MFQSAPFIGNTIHPNLVAFTHKFTELPAGWLPKIASEPIPLPMWGTLFLVNNPEHQAIIKATFRDIEDEADDDVLAGHWFAVADTGFVAYQIDSRVFLGVDGAGYCFYKAHWEPLFKLIYSS